MGLGLARWLSLYRHLPWPELYFRTYMIEIENQLLQIVLQLPYKFCVTYASINTHINKCNKVFFEAESHYIALADLELII